MVNAVGVKQVVGKFCKDCRFKCFWNCNCSRKTVYVITKLDKGSHSQVESVSSDATPIPMAGEHQSQTIESTRRFHLIIEQVGEDLKQGLQEMEAIFQRKKPRLETEAAQKIKNPNWTKWGIYTAAHDFLEDLGVSEEGWARLDCASALCGIDLNEKVRIKEGLTTKEWGILKLSVERVKKFGDASVAIWRLVQISDGDITGLARLSLLTREQKKILAKRLIKGTFEANCFAELSLEVKRVFFDAAECTPRAVLSRLPSAPFTQNESKDETRSIESHQTEPISDFTMATNREALRDALDTFLEKIGGVSENQEQAQKNRLKSFGVVVAQVLAIRLEHSPAIILKADLDFELLARLSQEFEKLCLVAGGVFHLFTLLKGYSNILSFENDELMKKDKQVFELFRHLPDVLCNYDLLYSAKKSYELGAVPPAHIALLSRIAEAFSEQTRAELNERYPFSGWLLEKRLEFSPLPAHSEEQSTPPTMSPVRTDPQQPQSPLPPHSEGNISPAPQSPRLDEEERKSESD